MGLLILLLAVGVGCFSFIVVGCSIADIKEAKKKGRKADYGPLWLIVGWIVFILLMLFLFR